MKGQWVKCTTCGRKAKLYSDWRPGKEYDPLMRRYVCSNGHYTFVILDEEQIKGVKLQER